MSQDVPMTIHGFKMTQRTADTLKKGEKLAIGDDCCYVLLPKDWCNKNIVLILTEE